MSRFRKIVLGGITIVTLFVCVCGCGRESREKEVDAAIREMMGQEVVIPSALEFFIQNAPVVPDLESSDYKIICYVDSADCTSCRLKLRTWTGIVNDIKTAKDVDVEAVIIVDTKDRGEILEILKEQDYRFPVAIDTGGIFAKRNKLPDKIDYQTFLVDSNNEIKAVGNPAYNPRIKELYKKIVMGESLYTASDNKSKGVGIVNPCDSVNVSFSIVNRDTVPRIVETVVPSCDCIEYQLTENRIEPGDSVVLTMAFVADTVAGPFRKQTDIYFRDIENPQEFSIHGYNVIIN